MSPILACKRLWNFMILMVREIQPHQKRRFGLCQSRNILEMNIGMMGFFSSKGVSLGVKFFENLCLGGEVGAGKIKILRGVEPKY